MICESSGNGSSPDLPKIAQTGSGRSPDLPAIIRDIKKYISKETIRTLITLDGKCFYPFGCRNRRRGDIPTDYGNLIIMILIFLQRVS